MNRIVKAMLTIWLAMTAATAIAEDIDLFASGLASGAAASSLPNVIFVLDNTSNWSRQSQKWPDGTQGQSEVQAIQSTLESIVIQNKDLNVAILEFTTDGNANQDGGYVRFDLQRLSENKTELFAILSAIDQGINDPIEKRNSNSSYGNLASDIYSYLAGDKQSFLGEGTPVSLADESGYNDPFVLFDSPMRESDICSETYVILISNPDSNGPEVDATENSDRLRALYTELGSSPSAALAGETGTGIMMPEFEEVRIDSEGTQVIGFSALGYRRVSQCTNAVNGNVYQSEEIKTACPDGGDCYCTNQYERCEGNLKCYQVERPSTDSEQESYGTTDELIDGVGYNLDDWTKFLHELGVPVMVEGEGDDPDTTIRVPVTTYTVDVFNAQPSETHSSLMESAAELGGGYRQSATNQAEIERALNRIFGDIIDINTSFAAVTLPLSATNRAQAENKVFVGMFRPASQRKPRWLGNLKQYQLAKFDGQIELADVNYDRAINPQTGFAQSCATSFWTTNTSKVPKSETATGPYFEGLGMDPSPVSECLSDFLDGRDVLSDSPDGPFVEKGGAAQQIRGQHTGLRTSDRSIFTQSGTGALTFVSEATAGGSAFFSYLTGEDAGLKGGDLKVVDETGSYVDNPALADEEQDPYLGLRPTIHGDIVHSRPLTITYGPVDPEDLTKGSDFRIFYGANDGLFRALDPATGREDWALIAEEHLDGLERLQRNTPTVDYFGLEESISTAIGAEPKRYFFDGSTGSFTEYDQDNELLTGLIFPTMRRGGRQIYALDVSPTGAAGVPPNEPTFLWKVGCPDLDSNTGCTSGFSDIGQTWSTPVSGRVKSDVEEATGEAADPILIFGGGWDACLDEDQAILPLSGCSKGNRLYVVNALSGALIREFETEAPVVAEVSALDIDNDGYLEFVYAADAAGNLYRLNFGRLETLADPYVEPLPEAEWFMSHIAKSSLATVRFLNKPTIGAIQNRVFVTIGSGDRERPLKQNYPYVDNVSNRFYAFVDEPYGEPSEIVDLDKATSESDRGMLNAALGLADGESLVDKHRGWYLDLPDRGEQIVNPSAIGGGFVFFNSFQPEGGTKGFCSDLGKSKAYRVPLFRPVKDEGKEFGEGVPIPPIIVTVKLDSGEPSCQGDACGPGEIPNEIVTVCIGCEGFDPIEIIPASNNTVREAYRAEDIDRL